MKQGKKILITLLALSLFVQMPLQALATDVTERDDFQDEIALDEGDSFGLDEDFDALYPQTGDFESDEWEEDDAEVYSDEADGPSEVEDEDPIVEDEADEEDVDGSDEVDQSEEGPTDEDREQEYQGEDDVDGSAAYEDEEEQADKGEEHEAGFALLAGSVTLNSVIHSGVMNSNGAFRVGPGTSHLSMRTISRGTTLEVLGENGNGNWLHVQIDGQVGWVYASRINRVNRTGVTNTGDVALRRGPGTSHASLRSLSRGSDVLILGRSATGNWIQVRADGQTGWIQSSQASRVDRNVVLNSNGAFRVGPGTSHSSLRTISHGTAVRVLGSSATGNWLLVRIDGQTGWIHASHTHRVNRTGVTNTGGVALRRGPGVSHSSIRSLSRGSNVLILGQSATGNWLQVRVDGQTGWIQSTQASRVDRNVVLNSNGAFRVGPGTSHSSLRTISRGTTVRVLGSSTTGNWLLVRADGQTGWIYASRTQRVNRIGVMNANGALRMGPGASHSSMRTVNRNTEVEILGSSASSNWVQVRVDGRTGWISNAQVNRVTRTGVLNSNGAFRVGPGTSHSSMRTINRGTQIAILGTSTTGRWSLVRINGEVGWSYTSRINRVNLAGVMTSNGAFRVGPGTSHSSMRTINNGSRVDILRTSADGRWLHVRHNNQLGWVYAARVNRTTRTGVMTSNGAFRVGPGTNHNSMRTVNNGTQVEVIGSSTNQEWLFVRQNNQVGWVYAARVNR